MPERAQRPCKHPGCPGLTRESYCSRHVEEYAKKAKEADAAYNRSRGSSASRGFDNVWQRLSTAYRQEHPLCEKCQRKGLVVPAVLVHHIVPIKEGGAQLDQSNCMSLCNPCHEAIHGKDRWKRRTYGYEDGQK